MDTIGFVCTPSGLPSNTCYKHCDFSRTRAERSGFRANLTQKNASIGTHSQPIFFLEERLEVSLGHRLTRKGRCSVPIAKRRRSRRSRALVRNRQQLEIIGCPTLRTAFVPQVLVVMRIVSKSRRKRSVTERTRRIRSVRHVYVGGLVN